MADKAISQLNAATAVTSVDLFVLEQSGEAKKLTGQILENWLVSFADGHGGIQSITKTGSTGSNPVIDTYTILLADETTTSFQVVNGIKGDTGDQTYVWIRYSHVYPTSDSDMGTSPDEWIGIYSGTSTTAPTHYTDYTWYQFKGDTGATGAAATITAATVGYQQSDSGSVVPEGSWVTTVPTPVAGKFLWTRIQIQFNTGSPITAYSVARYGIDGTGAVASVNSVSPDQYGNVQLVAGDIQALDSQSVQAHLDDDEQDIADLKTSLTKATGAIIYPTGDTTDRKAEIESRLSTYGFCEFVDGDYYISAPITLGNGQTIKGAGQGSVVRKTSNSSTNGMFNVTGTTQNVTIKDIKFLGENSAKPNAATSTGEYAVWVDSHAGAVTIENCVFEGLVRCGVYRASGYSVSTDSHLAITDCFFKYCGKGVEFLENGEFCLVTNCQFLSNYYGVYNQGGNNKFANCGFDANAIGFKLYDASTPTNTGHGSAVGCSFNHNSNYSINIENDSIGYVFDACNIWYGDVQITGSRGIIFSSCLMLGHKSESQHTDIIVSSCAGTIKFVDCMSLFSPTFAVTNSPYFSQCNWRLFGGDFVAPAKETLSTQYVSQSYVTEAAFNRLVFYMENGIIIARINLQVAASPGAEFRTIGKITYPYSVDGSLFVLPAQNNTGNLLFCCQSNGDVQIYSEGGAAATGWYRGTFPVV